MTERRILAIGNQKGGVGKTTTALNLGAELVNRGRTVVLVDADPQASLTASLGIDATDNSLVEVLGDHKPGTKKISEVIRKIRENGGRLWLVPSNVALVESSEGMMSRIGRELLLKTALAPIQAEYILIDCPPNLGLLTVNALVAADRVLVPVKPEFLDLCALTLFWRTMQLVEPLNAGLKLLGIVPTMTRNTNHHKEILATLGKVPAHIFDEIPQSIKTSEAHSMGRAVSALDSGNKVALAYAALAREVERLW